MQVPEYPSASHQPEPYQSVPQYPGPPPQYSQRGSSGGGLPTVVWVIVGAVIATLVSKVSSVVRSPGGVQGWVSRLYLHAVRTLLLDYFVAQHVYMKILDQGPVIHSLHCLAEGRIESLKASTYVHKQLHIMLAQNLPGVYCNIVLGRIQL